jgi:sigma-B regulation protein RsbU (phosphoserine phosphatase)
MGASRPAGDGMTSPRILVVDDEVDISTVLSVTLRRAGFDVQTAGDGIEAIEAIRREPPDLVILDVMMPRADGLETLKRIREYGPTVNLPVIMLSAKAQLADKIRGFDRGADDYVAKPFEPAEMLVRVQSLLKRTAMARLTAPLLGVLGEWSSTEGVTQLTRDLEAARDIQARLTPSVPPSMAGLEAGAVLRPSTMVGGDFFDILPMGERIAVAVGDVSGKGIPAALLMVMVRTLLREIARGLAEPADVLARLNASLCRDMPPSMFVTMVLAVLFPGREGRVALASAGHPEPILVRPGAAPKAVSVGGMMLGVFEEAAFEETEIDLESGDSLVFLTDGVIEAPGADGKRPGLDRVLRALDRSRDLGAQAQAEALTSEMLAEVAGRMRDDMTAFILKRP